MVAVGISMRSLSFSTCNSRFMLTGLLVLVGAGLMSCASTEELYAQYDEQFCPVDGYGAVSAIPSDTTVADTKVVERVVIKEVPAASATMMTWEPAVYYNLPMHIRQWLIIVSLRKSVLPVSSAI